MAYEFTEEQVDIASHANFTLMNLKRFYKQFKALDTDNDGFLTPSDLTELTEISDNPLIKRVISIFDFNKDGKISFIEFVVGLAKLFPSNDKIRKTKFTFDIYDMNFDDIISNGELFTVMKLMVGDNLSDVQLQQLVDRAIIKADKDGDGMISFVEFQEMTAHLDVAEKLQIDV